PSRRRPGHRSRPPPAPATGRRARRSLARRPAARRPAARRPRSQLELPELADEVVPEAPVPLLVDEAEPSALLDRAGGVKDVVGPEDDLAAAGAAGEGDAFLDEALADAEAARLGIDDQEPKLRHRRRFPHQKDRAHVLPVLLGDPAALALRIEA